MRTTLSDIAFNLRIPRERAYEVLRQYDVLPEDMYDETYVDGASYYYDDASVIKAVARMLDAEMRTLHYLGAAELHSDIVSLGDIACQLGWPAHNSDRIVQSLAKARISPVSSAISGEAVRLQGQIWYKKIEVSPWLQAMTALPLFEIAASLGTSEDDARLELQAAGIEPVDISQYAELRPDIAGVPSGTEMYDHAQAVSFLSTVAQREL